MCSEVFCCGCSLKIKTLVIGFFSLFAHNIVSVIVFHWEDGKIEQSSGFHKISSMILQVMVAVIVFIIHFCLIHGAVEEKKSFLVPYIGSFGSAIVAFTAYTVHSILFVSLTSQVDVYTDVIFPALLVLLILIIMVYSLMTVCKYHSELVKMKLDTDGVNNYLGYIYGSWDPVNFVASSKDISINKAIKF